VVEACDRADAKEALSLVAKLRELDPGYEKLADRVERRWLGSVKFMVLESTGQPGQRLTIKTPYSTEFVQFCRDHRFQWVPKPVKRWSFPIGDLPKVLDAIGQHYGGPNVLTTDFTRHSTVGPEDYTV
jgi:hypothetical protein